MKLRQIKSAGVLSEDARQRLEKIFFHDLDNATRVLQQHFPHHVVDRKGDSLQVMTRDRSIVVASFKDASAKVADTQFGLQPFEA
ncbi:MAG: hypothetical protein O7D34_12355 [Ignavibacteria bacterium]|nr:hypothetical protein [Ignavibacteria bacterium]